MQQDVQKPIDPARAGRWPPTPAVGYVVAFCLALAQAGCISLSRFAYAIVLPAMRNDLGWSYTQAGALNTVNAVGYLIGAVLVFASVRRLGAKLPYLVSIWLTVGTVLATAFLRDFNAISVVRFLNGMTTAYGFIAGGVLAASIFPGDARRSAACIAVFFSGGGLGLLLTAATLPWLLESRGDAAWPEAWMLLAAMIAVMCIFATVASRRINVPAGSRLPLPWSQRPLAPLIFAYCCYAFGYYGYMTFSVAWMREHGSSGMDIAVFWGVLGFASLLAMLVWTRPMVTWRGGLPFSAMMATVGIGAAIPLLGGSLGIMIVSALLYGTLFMVPAAVTNYIKSSMPEPLWGEVIAAFTLYFAVLQCVGPVATGYLADLTGSLATGLGISAAIIMLGAIVGLLQQPIE